MFLVLIVGAALTIYLLSRNTQGSASAASASPDSTPAASPAASVTAKPHGIPESVFVTHLESNEVFTAARSDAGERTWTLTYGKSPAVTALLLYDAKDGYITTLEISFYLPAQYDDESKSTIEQYLSEASKAKSDALPNAVRTILSDLLPVCDAESRLSATTARYWAEEAIQLNKQGADFEDTQSDARFIAFRAARSDLNMLVCTLYLDS